MLYRHQKWVWLSIVLLLLATSQIFHRGWDKGSNEDWYLTLSEEYLSPVLAETGFNQMSTLVKNGERVSQGQSIFELTHQQGKTSHVMAQTSGYLVFSAVFHPGPYVAGDILAYIFRPENSVYFFHSSRQLDPDILGQSVELLYAGGTIPATLIMTIGSYHPQQGQKVAIQLSMPSDVSHLLPDIDFLLRY